MANRAQVLCQRFGILATLGVGQNAGLAFAHARTAGTSRPLLLPDGLPSPESFPIDCLEDLAQPFDPDEDDTRALRRAVGSLRLLGLATLGQALLLPEHTLLTRIGRIASDALRVARVPTLEPAPWPIFQPEQKIVECVELADPETLSGRSDVPGLLEFAEQGLERLCARLRGRSLRLARLGVALELESGMPTRRWDIDFPIPQGSAGALVRLLRDRLQPELQNRPLLRPAVRLQIEAIETAPGHGAQRNFFDRSELEAEAWDALVARLCQKLGPPGAFIALPQARHLPERAWKAQLPTQTREAPAPTPARVPTHSPASNQASALTSTPHPASAIAPALIASVLSAPARPSRLLKRPLPLRWEGSTLVETQPLRESSRERRWNIVALRGPERLSGEWWDVRTAFDRDYYRVDTTSGESLWIFVNPKAEPSNPSIECHLHGFFD